MTLLAVALERLCGIDRAATTAGGRVAYTKDVGRGDRLGRRAGPTRPTRPSSSRRRRSPDIAAVARDGDVMPQKSTYFYPKPVTGLVLNPLEW